MFYYVIMSFQKEDELEEDIDVEELLELDDPEEEDEEEDIKEDDDDVDEEEIKEDDDDDEDELDIDIDDADEKELEIDIIEEEEDGATFADMYGEEDTFVSKRQRRVKIQRYCKSVKELVPRVRQQFTDLSPYLKEQIIGQFTSQHNASLFAPFVSTTQELYQLCGKLIKKEFSFAKLYEELQSRTEHWSSEIYKKEQQQEAREIQVMTVKLSVSEGLYQCNRCKSKKTYSRQVQTRSADEGMTSIIQCSECNKVWKEYA